MNVSLLSQHYWLSLTKETRDKLVKLFNIPHTGNSLVNYGPTGPVVQSDGYSPQDLMSISTEAMQEVLGSDSTDYYALLQDVINNIDSILDETYLEKEIEEEVEEFIEEVKKPKKKPKKK